MKTFAERLDSALHKRGPLCVGVDPHPELLQAWDLPLSADGLERFAEICVEAYDGHVAVVKPQVAFFEPFGSAGILVLENMIKVFRGSGTLVLADAKRGDIGSTMDAYARAWLDESSPLCSDAVTVSPYLGFGSLEPALAHTPERGVFVLAATSNPEGAQVQQGTGLDGRSISQTIVDEAGARNASVGVVVGATLTHAPDLSRVNGPILMPGVGAQGGGADTVRNLVGDNTKAVLPAVSRDVLKAGPSVDKLRAEVRRWIDHFEFLRY